MSNFKRKLRQEISPFKAIAKRPMIGGKQNAVRYVNVKLANVRKQSITKT